MDPLHHHRGWRRAFAEDRLTVGIALPVQATRGAPPDLGLLAEHARLVDELGFAAIWLRDITLLDPDAPDHGQGLDPFVALGMLAGATPNAALGVASIVLPIRHPLHIARAALSVDALSGGRFLLGVGNGWRPTEYAATGLDHAARATRFRHALAYLSALLTDSRPMSSPLGAVPASGSLVLPPRRVPILLTGNCALGPDAAAQLGDGHIWIPRADHARAYHAAAARAHPGRFSPYVTLVRVDLRPDGHGQGHGDGNRDGDSAREPVMTPQGPVRRLTADGLLAVLRELERADGHHVMLDLRWSTRPVEHVLAALADDVLPRHAAGPSAPPSTVADPALLGSV